MKRRLTERISIDFGENNPEWARIRNAEGLVNHLRERGAEWADRLNGELHEAQAKRGQPVEDGYDYTVTHGGSRARLHVTAFTARAMAHEARNQSLLKMMPIGDVKHPVDPDLPRELGRRSAESRGGE